MFIIFFFFLIFLSIIIFGVPTLSYLLVRKYQITQNSKGAGGREKVVGGKKG